ncbi:mechanosensitive ion channel family protein [Moraxella cuniculi]|uniref:mechanosensitive ion channel family protein n=1 Tax=Moraxella cuniculi TaxID=34061 RepID=UPI001D0D60EB|nr:mechanosensitive ion channel family protein [Moraxella cuniculi]
MRLFLTFLRNALGVLCVLGLFLMVPVQANTTKWLNQDKQTAAQPQAEPDSFGRETPRGTVQGLLKAIAAGDDELATKYLDGRYLASSKTPNREIVERLIVALDAGGRLYPDLQINHSSEGNLSDNLPSDIDKVGEIVLMNERFDILLNRRVDDNGVAFWQVSAQTLQNLPTTTKHTQTLSERLKFSTAQTDTESKYWLELAALLLLVVALYAVINLLVWLLYWVSKLAYTAISHKPFRVTPSVIMPLSLVVVALILPEVMLKLGVPLTLRNSFGRIKDMIAWGAVAWLMLRLLDAVFRRAEANSLKRARPEQVSILNLLRKVAKVFLLIFVLILIFGNLGFDLTTGIAALGVGGLALAFGAQKSIENLIGSVVVVADRPVHVGDYCKFGTYEGVVTDIGIRSTRIRTLNRTVVTVPNGEFSSLQIENFTARDMFYFLHELFIKRTADLAEIERMIAELQAYLAAHELTNDEWNQVWIRQLRQDCYVIEMRAYIAAADARDFYAKQTKLLIDVLRQVEQYSVEHALPSQSVLIDKEHD